MNSPIKRLLIFITVVTFLGISWKTITCYLTGHLKYRNGKSVNPGKFHVFVISNGHVLGRAITDLKGNFELMLNTGSVDTLLKFYCFNSKKDTFLMKKITGFNSEEPDITFYLPKQ